MRLSLRTRLIIAFSVTIVTTGAVSTSVGAWMIGKALSDQAQNKAKHDLNTARLILQNAVNGVRDTVRLTSLNLSLQGALAHKRPADLAALLDQIRRRESLDILDLMDADGHVIVRAQNPARTNDHLFKDDVVAAAVAASGTVAAIGTLDAQTLRNESPELAARARIREFDDGMVIKAASVVLDGRDRRIGTLFGAKLLNHDIRIVDEIKRAAYQGDTFKGEEIGAGTICLGDTRIATNVKDGNGNRAIGTRVDRPVSSRVLQKGLPWVANATVLGDRHITAYEPIRDLSGRVIGILSLGISERAFQDIHRAAYAVFFGITLCGILLSILVAQGMARRIENPTRKLVEAVRSIGQGDLDYRVKLDESIREIDFLGSMINQMAQSIQQRDLQLKYRTQEHIGKSDRLAMIGHLAAGVAHEINNPLGGIMLFSNLLLRKAAPSGQDRENLERICSEAQRCKKIVEGLLDFSRQREPKVEKTRTSEVLERTLRLIENHALFHNIRLVRDYADAGNAVQVDPTQMQQVFMNIILNAVDAMNGKGKLTISTRAVESGHEVEIQFSDTGCGIPPENLDRLFEPFFSTKEVGRGTGLGLSISRGIVENHQGTIWATSRSGEGATFYIRLPAFEEMA